MKYFEISPLISPRLAVFPGDVAFSRQISLDAKLGQHLTLSSVQTTLHLGAHADSTSHYHQAGQGVERRQLEAYLGDCQVIRVGCRAGSRVSPQDISDKKIVATRVLIATNSFPNPEKWNDDFMSLSPELIHHLHGQGVKLVGIDTPSVDPFDSKKLESHQALYTCGMAVLEGLDLSLVPEGLYTLVALPLRIEDGDASPVRAILLAKSGLI